VEMNVEEFYVPDDVLDEASAAKYQMVPTKSKLPYQKELEIFTELQTEKRINGKDENVMAYFKKYRVIHLLPPVAKLTLKIMISLSYFADLIYYL
jgi:hypothetical protein